MERHAVYAHCTTTIHAYDIYKYNNIIMTAASARCVHITTNGRREIDTATRRRQLRGTACFCASVYNVCACACGAKGRARPRPPPPQGLRARPATWRLPRAARPATGAAPRRCHRLPPRPVLLYTDNRSAINSVAAAAARKAKLLHYNIIIHVTRR